MKPMRFIDGAEAKRSRFLLMAVAVIGALLLFGASETSAQDRIFTNMASGTFNWSDSENWLDGVVPALVETNTVIVWPYRAADRTIVMNLAGGATEQYF